MGVADALSRQAFQVEAAREVAAFMSKAKETEVFSSTNIFVIYFHRVYQFVLSLLCNLFPRAYQFRRSAMSLGELEHMVKFCSLDGSLLVIKLALIFGFFAYLCLSILVPETVVGFDRSRHTSWCDVVPSKHGVMIYLKWTKTLQSQKGCTPVPLPCLLKSIVCPVGVWSEYAQLFLGHVGSAATSMLLTTGPLRGNVVSASQLRAMFYRVTTALDLGHRHLTPNSMRRGGGGGGDLQLCSRGSNSTHQGTWNVASYFCHWVASHYFWRSLILLYFWCL